MASSATYTRSHAVARRNLLYVFYGHYWTGNKSYPIVKAIHLKLTNDRRRFAKVIHPAFKVFFQLLHDDISLHKFLDDGGKGKPPAAYLAGVEQALRELGLRSVRTCVIHDMRTCVIITRVLACCCRFMRSARAQ